jgi:hypothetical protein
MSVIFLERRITTNTMNELFLAQTFDLAAPLSKSAFAWKSMLHATLPERCRDITLTNAPI